MGTTGGTIGGTIGGTFAVPVLKAVGTTWSPNIAHAQTEVTANLDAVAELSGLSTPDDPRDVIANLIYGFLGILGVIFTVLVIWAGLRWMLAAGDPKKVNSAKQMLISAIIGLGIILSSWAITYFVINSILGATGGGAGGGGDGGGGGNYTLGGGGGVGTFEVTALFPTGELPTKNLVIQATFSNNLLAESVTPANFTITNASTGIPVLGTLVVSGNLVKFTPAQACPAPDADIFCFDSFTEYTIAIKETVLNTSEVALSCANSLCSGSFTSGDLIDREDPRAETTLPDDHASIPAESLVATQMHGTDDTGLSIALFSVDGVQFDAIPSAGMGMIDGLFDTFWESLDVVLGESYEITTTALDYSGNEDSDSITVVAKPASCFNDVQDLGEIGVDCGGDPSLPEYCGACGGAVCKVESDCGGGLSCVSGFCVVAPEISAVSPNNGAPGTYVTIQGSGFGGLTGSVYFIGVAGAEVLAPLADCALAWTDNQVIVEVPVGAISGPISLFTRTLIEDSTIDDNGPQLPDFSVDSVLRPGLCALEPNSASGGDAVTVIGNALGATQESSTIIFGASPAPVYSSWSDKLVSLTVPPLNDGLLQVTATVNGIISNPVNFTVQSEAVVTPIITSVSPAVGPPGQYITISGANFGDQLGTINLESEESGEQVIASIDFPPACLENIWSAQEVLVIIPELLNGHDILFGDYSLTLVTQAGVISNPVILTVTDTAPTPGLCALSPEIGLADTALTGFGDNFGTSNGSLIFTPATPASISTWADDSVSALVPSGAQTGYVTLETSDGVISNPLTFEVGAGTIQSTATPVAAYAWNFSTGIIPIAPQVIVECSDSVVSAVPNEIFTDAVCVNASIFAEFTTPMNEVSTVNATTVSKCTAPDSNPCLETTLVSVTPLTTPTTITLSPLDNLEISTTYQVIISTLAQSLDGTPLSEDVVWEFTTKPNTTVCTIEEIFISPDTITLTAEGETAPATALAKSGCIVLNSDPFIWDWSISADIARLADDEDLSCIGEPTSCSLVEALAEGEGEVTATVDNISGLANLLVNFTDPYVLDYWPDCEEACVNAEVGASFNIGLDPATVGTVGAVQLFECANELCLSLSEISGIHAVCSTINNECDKVTLTGLNLIANKFYKVVLSGTTLASPSGVPLTRLNDGGNYSWQFRTREDASICALERIDLAPSDYQVEAVGESGIFAVSGFGEADVCAQSGQALDSTQYNWEWENPILDSNLDDNLSTTVSEWYYGGTVDTDLGNLPLGCNALCLPLGSLSEPALCGDGVLGLGEECEDGNTMVGDGCSDHCLREGAIGASVCGNGEAEQQLIGLGFSGEDCDDGNLENNDGCSSTCLAEGSSAIGATCGNGDIAVLGDTEEGQPSLAGEECDDGDGQSGDGCSSQCLNEGSPTLALLGGALCSNGVIEPPSEQCDDDNLINGDSCSDTCLFEGSNPAYGSTCGDGTIGKGESCDDGATDPDPSSGDGCSEICLLEGSSPWYATPAYCGDGLVAPSESPLCETSSGLGTIDPLQTAFTTENAPFEVDLISHLATSTIRVQESDSNLETSANFSLYCAAQTDSQCLTPETLGVGAGGCCIDRPEVTLFPTGKNVCRNATVYGEFSQKMDLESFIVTTDLGNQVLETNQFYARLDLVGSGLTSCPADHLSLAHAPRSFLARVWNSIWSWLTGKLVNADAGDCILPILDYQQVPLLEGDHQVSLNLGIALAPNASYEIVVVGDEDIFDDQSSGVRSQLDVALNGTVLGAFTTGPDLCALSEIIVTDTDLVSPQLFTSIIETHLLSAQAVSIPSPAVSAIVGVDGPIISPGVPQLISPVPGVYEWSWSPWEIPDNEAIALSESTALDLQIASALGENGVSQATASVEIITDTLNLSAGNTLSGTIQLTALLCENLWPAPMEAPWSDTAESEDIGADYDEAIGWTNFSSFYCRDQGADDISDDLPSLTVVRPPFSGTANIIKEYLFKIADGSGDAIGVRIATNEEYLSPSAWYESQGFVGSPSPTTVAGYKAVQDGRTTYVSAPNQSDSAQLYLNIYAISYNEGASPTTINIYNQMVTNLLFTVNLTDLTQSNLLKNDANRLTDATDLQAMIISYGEENGACSLTESKLCSGDLECPVGETCEALVPNLSSGSFVRGLSSSAWDSWETILGGALDQTMPVDPLNNYLGCGEEGGEFSQYSATTCVDEIRGQYICPLGSQIYHYRTIGAKLAQLNIDLEYQGGEWDQPLEIDETDTVIMVAGNHQSSAVGFSATPFCDGQTVYGLSGSCGDGVVGVDEVCELGQVGSTTLTCDLVDPGDALGLRYETCNASCSGYEIPSESACVPFQCGNGVIELGSGEECDDGVLNGTYGFCGGNCTYDSAVYCGDGTLAGGEQCDCGALTTPLNARAYEADPGSCANVNGIYNANPNAGCAWDCAGPAAYCGDNTINLGEVCDGASETWAGALCDDDADDLAGFPCITNADCGVGTCGFTDPACEVGDTRVKTCQDDPGSSCTYVQDNWWQIPCTAIGSCGDGTLDPDEICDDGNDDSSDDCTNDCQVNVCGDGYLYAGKEQCDQGIENGGGCESEYGVTCTACSRTCHYEVITGNYCGDGLINGGEYCDGSQVPLVYYSDNTQTAIASCAVLGQITADGYECLALGACNGGGADFNGNICGYDSECGTGSCTPPRCSGSCLSSCPLGYANIPLLITSNQPGDKPADSVELYTYSSDPTSDIPNAATISVPACTVADSASIDVNFDKVFKPDLYAVMIVDRSLTMGDSIDGGVKLDIAKEVISDSISGLFDELGDLAHITVMGFAANAGTGLCTIEDTKISDCTKDENCDNSATCTEILDFIDQTNSATLMERVNQFTTYYETNTPDAFAEAKNLLDAVSDSTNVRKVAIILSDGEAYVVDNDDVVVDPIITAANAAFYSDEFKNAGFELYTVSLGTEISWIEDMESWSSNNPPDIDDAGDDDYSEPPSGVDYAYNGNTADELSDIYEVIVDSLTGFAVTIISGEGEETKTSTAELLPGQNLQLPWPELFECDGVSEQELPIQFSFVGEGTISVSNLNLEYCSP